MSAIVLGTPVNSRSVFHPRSANQRPAGNLLQSAPERPSRALTRFIEAAVANRLATRATTLLFSPVVQKASITPVRTRVSAGRGEPAAPDALVRFSPASHILARSPSCKLAFASKASAGSTRMSARKVSGLVLICRVAEVYLIAIEPDRGPRSPSRMRFALWRAVAKLGASEYLIAGEVPGSVSFVSVRV